MSIRKLLRNIKWKFQRSRGKLPECDCWDFSLTLADVIVQGLRYLLNNENRSGEWVDKGETRRELGEVLEFFEDYLEGYGMVDVERLPDESGAEWIARANKLENDYLKKCEKYMGLLGKHIWDLWD